MYLSIVTWLLVWFRSVVVFITVEGLVWFIGGLVSLLAWFWVGWVGGVGGLGVGLITGFCLACSVSSEGFISANLCI